jgi:tRNA pseudouridine55 synthase
MELHGILVIDKPRGLTSHDVVARIRRLLKTKKVGHAGTLDPAAEGVLVLAVGRATKLLAGLSTHTKRYAAQVVLGVGSISGDVEGPAIRNQSNINEPSVPAINAILEHFTGDIEQVPPAHAAIKVDGQPLYRRARRGESVEVPSRNVHISSLSLIDYQYPNLYLDVECSAGTYIRSLARDIGGALDTSAYLHYLLRVRSGDFSIDDAWTLDELEHGLNPESFTLYARHPSTLRCDQIALVLRPDATNAWYDGRPVAGSGRTDVVHAHAFQAGGSWLGTGVSEGQRDFWQPKMVVHV